ncbi:MAG TPA: hypothetical protein VGB04_14720 [Allosphingosinicella sp.]
MNLLPFLASAAAQLANPGPTPDQSKLLAELAARCRLPSEGLSTDLDILDYAGLLAGRTAPMPHCRSRDPDLALRLARMLAEAPSAASDDAYALLADWHEKGLGVEKNSALALSYRRRAWLLGWVAAAPFDGPQEARAYLVAPETIGFLRGRVARGALGSEWVRLAEALLARRAAGDLAEARTLLKSPEAGTESRARLMLAEAALEPDATAADVAQAAARLRPAASLPSDGPGARALLLRLGRLQLAKAGTAEETWDSIQSLAAAAYAGEADPVRAFREALKAANGGLEPATVDAAAPPPRIQGDDYPASAIRRGATGGVVRLRALVDPRGIVIFTESLEPAQPADFVGAVRAVYARRPVPPVQLAAARPTPYVWMAVRPVSFRLSE